MSYQARYCFNSMKETPSLIAVVDDEPSILLAMKRLLRSAGLDVETYSSGEEFLQAAETRRFDCVVLDLHMPYFSGLEVLSQLAQLETHIPAVVVTGHDTPDARPRALAAGQRLIWSNRSTISCCSTLSLEQPRV
jgi:FixJ family two-component response regulator